MESLIEKLVKNNVKKFYFTSVMSKEHEMNIVISLSKEDYEMLTRPNSRNERIEMLLSKQEQNGNKNKVKMTKTEYTILKNINSDYSFIARDKNGTLNIYLYEPEKDRSEWVGGYSYLSMYNHLFEFIQWQDGEPYNIKELLENCEVCDG